MSQPFPTVATPYGEVPTTDPATKGGPLPRITSEGRGVVGGKPYGEQLQTERAEMDLRWKLLPGHGSRLRGATRKALGR